MKIIFGVFIFCIVLFMYLHIQFHLRTSEDLEIYEIEQASKEKLEEICDIRQPVLFDFEDDKIISNTKKDFISSNYPAFELKIRNTTDHETNNNDPSTNSESELYIPLPLHTSIKLFDEDTQSQFYSENNSDFLTETGVIKSMQYNDEFLRPYMVSNCNYDIMFGSEKCTTPFRYEINYRNYFLVTQGSIQIKMTPPHSTRYLYPQYDYENFEFKSPVNPWNPQTKYSADFDKIKCLEVSLREGQIIFIPAYWWYSIEFGKNSSISCFRYRTYMNNIAIIPYVFLYVLQNQNIKRNMTKKLGIEELNMKKENEQKAEEKLNAFIEGLKKKN